MSRKGTGSKRNWQRDNATEDRFIAELDRFLEAEAVRAALRAAKGGGGRSAPPSRSRMSP